MNLGEILGAADKYVADAYAAKVEQEAFVALQSRYGGDLRWRPDGWEIVGASVEGRLGRFSRSPVSRRIVFLAATGYDDEPSWGWLGDPPANDNGRFALTWFDDIAPSKPKKHVIKGIFAAGEFSTVAGLPGCGKSALLTDAACHVAAGKDWHDRPVNGGFVVYLAAERKELTERRMLAFRNRYGVRDVPLLVVGGRVDFTHGTGDARQVASTIKRAEDQLGAPCVWIIVDTLTRTFGGGDQNTSQDMGRYIASCDLLLHEIGAHLTVVHHTSWDGKRGKGAIDLDGAVDASFLVAKEAGTHTFTCDGTNDGEAGKLLDFRMESEVVGVDDETGEETTAPVVVPAGPGVGLRLVASIRATDAAVLHSLVRAVADAGTETGAGRGVTADVWRASYKATQTGSTDAAILKRFDRGKHRLLDAGHIRSTGIRFMPAGQTGQPDN